MGAKSRIPQQSHEISKADLASLKRESGSEQLDIGTLVDEANKRIGLHNRILNDMPSQYFSDFKKSIVNYFLSSAVRFDRNQKEGLNKYEFNQYKNSMLRHIKRITDNHKPSVAERFAAEKQRRKFKAVRKKFEEDMNKSIRESNSGLDFNANDLEKKGRIPQEMYKIQKQNARIQSIVATTTDTISRFSQDLRKWNSMSSASRNANSGVRSFVVSSLETARQDKSNILPKLRKIQKKVHQHGEKLSKAAKSLKEKFIKRRNYIIQKAGKKNKKKRNEQAYRLLKEEKDNFRLNTGVTPEVAIKKIDNIMANPFKYGLSSQGMKKLISQRAMILKLVGRVSISSGFDDELFNINQKVGRTLETEQNKNGNMEELLMAKFAPMEDALNQQIKNVDELALQADIGNSQMINMLESSIDKFSSNKVKDVGNSWTGFFTNTVTPWVRSSLKMPARGLYMSADLLRNTKYFKLLGAVCDLLGGVMESAGAAVTGVVTIVGDPATFLKGLGALVNVFDLKGMSRAWGGLGDSFMATDEFAKGNYARGTGKIAGNILTFLVGGEAVTANVAREAGVAGRVVGKIGSARNITKASIRGSVRRVYSGVLRRGGGVSRRVRKMGVSNVARIGRRSVSIVRKVVAKSQQAIKLGLNNTDVLLGRFRKIGLRKGVQVRIIKGGRNILCSIKKISKRGVELTYVVGKRYVNMEFSLKDILKWNKNGPLTKALLAKMKGASIAKKILGKVRSAGVAFRNGGAYVRRSVARIGRRSSAAIKTRVVGTVEKIRSKLARDRVTSTARRARKAETASAKAETASGTINHESFKKTARRNEQNAEKMRRRGHDFLDGELSIAQKFKKLFKEGDEIIIKRTAGNIERGWVIDKVLHNGAVRVYKVFGEQIGVVKEIAKEDILNMCKNKTLRRKLHSELRNAKDIIPFRKLGFREGSIIKVLRSRGITEDGWRIVKETENGFYEVIKGKLTKKVTKREILHSNPKGPHIPRPKPHHRVPTALEKAQGEMLKTLALTKEQVRMLQEFTKSVDALKNIQEGLNLIEIKTLKGLTKNVAKKKYLAAMKRHHPDLADANMATEAAQAARNINAANDFIKRMIN